MSEVIKEGLPWPESRNRLAGAALNAFLGSRSPNFAPVEWHRTAIPPEDANAWPEFDGDPRVWEWRGIWYPPQAKWAGIVAVRSSFTETMREHSPHLKDGVATVSLGGDVWAGIMPKGFGRIEVGDETYDAVAGRIGRNALRITPVLIDPEISQVIVPLSEDLRTVGAIEFKSEEVPQAYARVPVV
jgi:hypothetical protein